MSEWASNVLIWTGVGAFVAVVIFGLLALFGLIEPRDPESGKWATRKVLFPLVVAVGAAAAALFASGQFDKPKPSDPQVSDEHGIPGVPDDPGSIDEPAIPDPNPGSQIEDVAGQETPEPAIASEEEISCIKPAPGALVEWASEALGPRPDFECSAKQNYPSCVSELRGRGSGETSAVEAAECGKAVADYRRSVIAPVLQIKASYDSNLDDQEKALRVWTSGTEEQQRDYVLAEIARMNGAEWRKFSAKDSESKFDLHVCYSNARCRLSH